MITDLERRSAPIDADGEKIRGVAIVFDTPSLDLGGFVEIIESRAVDRTLAGQADVLALTHHDMAQVLGRTPDTLTLEKRSGGLHVVITPPATSWGRDTLESVRRRDIRSMSIGFRVPKGGDRFETRAGHTARIITDLDLVEVSVVALAAYPQTDASVAQRSLRQYQARQGPAISWLRLSLTAGR